VCIVPAKRKRAVTVHRRLNITLPERTVRLLARVARPGDRSRLIAAAVERYVEEVGRGELRRRLKEGAIRRAERDLGLAEAFFHLEEEAWPADKR
jgi:CopG family transcriptional regulator/antitoxin EndoAI